MPPRPLLFHPHGTRAMDGFLGDAELLKRLGGLYGKALVAGVPKELAEAR